MARARVRQDAGDAASPGPSPFASSSDHARQHITGAGSGERGGRAGAHGHRPAGLRHDRVVALEHDH